MNIGKPSKFRNGDNIIRDAAQELNKAMNSDFTLHAVMNCITPNDPNKDVTLCGYWGEHYTTMSLFLESAACDQNLRKLKRLTRTVRACPFLGQEINVLFWCRSGRHRSVAQAAFAKHVLEESGFEVDVIHWHSVHWPEGFCTTCSDCGPESEEMRMVSKAKCLEMWRSY